MKRECKRHLICCLIIVCIIGAIGNAEASRLSLDDQPTASQNSIGPFELHGADSNSSIRFQSALQLRTQFERIDQDHGKPVSERLFMEARRIRLSMTASIAEPSITCKLHLSVVPRSLEMMDYFFNYRMIPNLQVRFGQFKTPFTRYRFQSFQRLTCVDWSVVTRYFGAERQMGFVIHNGYEKPAKFSYMAGLFTGVNARASHAVALPKLYGLDLSNPSDLADPGLIAEFHPELFLHLAHNSRGMEISSDSDELKGGLRYSAAFSAAWDTDPVADRDLTVRLAPELIAKYRGASASIIGYAGYGGVGSPVRTKLILLGGLAQTAYRFSKRWELSARYAVIDIRNALIRDVIESTDKTISEQIFREHETTFGLNIYLVGHKLKWQNDTVWLRHIYSSESRDDIMVRSQFQFSF